MKCNGKMVVVERTPCTIFTKCNKCGATDNFSIATRHYYNGCIKNKEE